MGKYEPLTHYLETVPDDAWDARFDDIAKVLGFALPRSAHDYAAWWANQEPGKSQTAGWRDAGWETCNVDLSSKRVRFVRAKQRPKQTVSGDELDALLDKARMVTGIEDRDALLKAALNALINRELAHYFASLGGSMPDFQPAPRERPFA